MSGYGSDRAKWCVTLAPRGGGCRKNGICRSENRLPIAVARFSKLSAIATGRRSRRGQWQEPRGLPPAVPNDRRLEETDQRLAAAPGRSDRRAVRMSLNRSTKGPRNSRSTGYRSGAEASYRTAESGPSAPLSSAATGPGACSAGGPHGSNGTGGTGPSGGTATATPVDSPRHTTTNRYRSMNLR